MNQIVIFCLALCLLSVNTQYFFQRKSNVTEQRIPYVNYFNGLISGLGDNLTIDAYMYGACLQNQTYPERQNILEGALLLNQNSTSDVYNGFKLIGNSTLNILNLASMCSVQYEEADFYSLKVFVHEMIDATRFTITEDQEIFMDAVNATEVRLNIIKAFIQQDVNKALDQIAHEVGVLVGLFKMEERRVVEAYEEAKIVVPQVMNGFAYGFAKKSGFTAEVYVSCFEAKKANFHLMEQAFLDILHARFEEGLHQFILALEGMSQGLAGCRGAIEETSFVMIRLMQVVNECKSKENFKYQLAQNIKANRRQIHRELRSAQKSYQHRGYSEAGFLMGEVTYQLFVGESIGPKSIQQIIIKKAISG